ncbi:NUDIX hydrolase [Rhodocyclus tenuis]|uniref:ADP-ribose pyrophosphatase YjhB (NUDIX family) n=1 Tax=Rhodocyclus tenuis TaxID=1066 RepID=A0A840FY26_RHOTE|nr:NUDIX hydrolase [Rhodocyclus tenuis]MBB4246724.1 ADP-ribose pyrophosphatase YjhB (NUDIX family) [Rhodocyclus tenuis]
MKFCNLCGAPLILLVPPGDNFPRHVCSVCGEIHYRNPKLVVGCIAEWNERILLCRRAIEPRHGRWTLPAGFMENGETTQQAAVRETCEEACARVEIDALASLISIPAFDQVHLFYRGRLVDGDFGAGAESLESALFTEADIPWSEIAFQSVTLALRAYFADRTAGRFLLHEHDLHC